ncbi:hypothetical protein COB57_03160 [Candidatus Peregrinibacteria bacterium]|nr:MAG: hypothetical protein COB57_03160 [Candidatus Peregrinibacteria bacterium]
MRKIQCTLLLLSLIIIQPLFASLAPEPEFYMSGEDVSYNNKDVIHSDVKTFEYYDEKTQIFIPIDKKVYHDYSSRYEEHYGKDKNRVYYIDYEPTGDADIITDADPKTFYVFPGSKECDYPSTFSINEEEFLFSSGYSKDKNQVYLRGNVIKNADPSSFEFITCVYTKDKNHVYVHGKVIEEAHPQTFQMTETGIAHDGESVFLGTKKIKNTDPYTFEHLEYNYDRDKDSIFYNREILPIADRESFEITDINQIAKDKNHVFHHGKVMTSMDSKSLKKIQKIYSDYIKDDNYIFLGGHNPNDYNLFEYKILPDADPESFTGIYKPDDTHQSLSRTRYTKDKDTIWYENKPMQIDYDRSILEIIFAVIFPWIEWKPYTIDIDSFEIIDDTYSKDTYHVFYKTQAIKNMDPKTFTILEDEYSQDEDDIAYKEKTFHADTSHFTVLYNDLSSDGNNIYYQGQKTKLSPQVFKKEDINHTLLEKYTIQTGSHLFSKSYYKDPLYNIERIEAPEANCQYDYSGSCDLKYYGSQCEVPLNQEYSIHFTSRDSFPISHPEITITHKEASHRLPFPNFPKDIILTEDTPLQITTFMRDNNFIIQKRISDIYFDEEVLQ